MSKLTWSLIAILGLPLGGAIACTDDDGGDGGPTVCHEEVDACDQCPKGLTCGPLAAGGYECYTPCDTVDDCGHCETEMTCGYGEGDRMLCILLP